MKDNDKKGLKSFDDFLMPYLTDDEKILNKESDIAKDALLFGGKDFNEGLNKEVNENIDESEPDDISGSYEENKVHSLNDNKDYSAEEENSISDYDENEENYYKSDIEGIDSGENNDNQNGLNTSKQNNNQNKSMDVGGGKYDMLPNMVMLLILSVIVALVFLKGWDVFHGFESLLFFIVWASILSYVSIIIHEGGHFIFGKLSGYEFASFRIGNIMFVKNNGKMTYKRYHIPGTGGQCLMIPPDVKDDKYDFPNFLYSLGGVIMNFIFGGICLISYIMLPYVIFLSEGLIMGVGLSLYFGLLNGIPRKIGGIANDGANALYLDEDINSKKAFYSQLKINGLLTKGVRLKDMDESLFDVDERADYLNPLVSAMVTLKCNYLVDKKEFDKAKELILYSLDNLTDMLSVHKSELRCELLFLELMGECDKYEIDRLMNDDIKRYIETTKNYYVSRRRQLYAYELLYNEDEYKAKEQLDAFKRISSSYPYETELEGEIELLHATHDKAVERGIVKEDK